MGCKVSEVLRETAVSVVYKAKRVSADHVVTKAHAVIKGL
jgi:hypothetical protein